MIQKIKELWENKEQRNEMITYVVMGLLTTIVNYAVYLVCTWAFGIDKLVANVIAWILAVVFAFVTNRKWVFKSKKNSPKEIGQEFFYFVGGRLASLVIFDVALFTLMVNTFKMNDLLVKLITNVGVVIFNYFVGKFLVFKKK